MFYVLKIAIITSKLGEGIIKEVLRREPDIASLVKIISLDVPAIGLMSASMIADHLKNKHKELSGIDLILVPGTIRDNVSPIQEATGIETYKGPDDPSDLPRVIKAVLEGASLSKEVSATIILGLDIIKTTFEELKKMKREYIETKSGLKIPLRPPPFIIVSEIPPHVSVDDICRFAQEYEEYHSDIIVLGFGYEEVLETAIAKLKTLSKCTSKAIGIETQNSELIAKLSHEENVDIVFGLTKQHTNHIYKMNKDTVYVVATTTSPTDNYVTNIYDDLRGAVNVFRSHGMQKIVVDPVLRPPFLGLAESIVLYDLVARNLKDTPIAASISNVAENMDADSIGVNALLVSILGELGVSIFYVVKDKWKARYSLPEVFLASTMATISLVKKRAPEDLGVDMLFLRDKNPAPPLLENEETTRELIIVKDVIEPSSIEDNYVRITVDHDEKMIKLAVYSIRDPERKPIVIIKGTDAMSILRQLIQKDLIKLRDHIAYIGYELGKAETALITGKKYVQDMPLIESINSKIERVQKWLKHK